jgi:hypothetical protein
MSSQREGTTVDRNGGASITREPTPVAGKSPSITNTSLPKLPCADADALTGLKVNSTLVDRGSFLDVL